MCLVCQVPNTTPVFHLLFGIVCIVRIVAVSCGCCLGCSSSSRMRVMTVASILGRFPSRQLYSSSHFSAHSLSVTVSLFLHETHHLFGFECVSSTCTSHAHLLLNVKGCGALLPSVVCSAIKSTLNCPRLHPHSCFFSLQHTR